MPGQSACNGACVDTKTDNNNCGACTTASENHACTGGQTCQSGKCQCPSGQIFQDGQCTPCSSQFPDVCSNVCVNIHEDNANCGLCGIVCSPGQICTNGQCQVQCSSPSQTPMCGNQCCEDANGGLYWACDNGVGTTRRTYAKDSCKKIQCGF